MLLVNIFNLRFTLLACFRFAPLWRFQLKTLDIWLISMIRSKLFNGLTHLKCIGTLRSLHIDFKALQCCAFLCSFTTGIFLVALRSIFLFTLTSICRFRHKVCLNLQLWLLLSEVANLLWPALFNVSCNLGNARLIDRVTWRENSRVIQSLLFWAVVVVSRGVEIDLLFLWPCSNVALARAQIVYTIVIHDTLLLIFSLICFVWLRLVELVVSIIVFFLFVFLWVLCFFRRFVGFVILARLCLGIGGVVLIVRWTKAVKFHQLILVHTRHRPCHEKKHNI